MRFEWDPEKDKTNRAKHGLSFEEASELFEPGVDYLEIYDEEHSDEGIVSSPSDRSGEVSSWSPTRNVMMMSCGS